MTVCPLNNNFIIYKITNLVNGKVYIGQTVRLLEYRKNKHIADAQRGSDCLIHRAMRKYRIENFSFEIVANGLTKEEANQKEIEIICKQNSKTPNGYNMTGGGEGSLGMVFSQETREKHRHAMIGNKINLGRIPTEETRIKLSLAKRGRQRKSTTIPKTEKWYAAMHATKGRISNRLGCITSEATKEKQRIASTGRKHTVEAKAKIKAAWIVRKQNIAISIAA